MFGKKRDRALKERVNALVATGEKTEKATLVARLIRPRAERSTSFADCTIFYAGSSSVAGIIINHSETGLRVRFRHRHALPERIRVVSPRLGIDRIARVVRRLDFDIGLHFLD
ncbi:MAG: PilZ domain-containing protein [Pseudomonadota bacterium]